MVDVPTSAGPVHHAAVSRCGRVKPECELRQTDAMDLAPRILKPKDRKRVDGATPDMPIVRVYVGTRRRGK